MKTFTNNRDFLFLSQGKDGNSNSKSGYIFKILLTFLFCIFTLILEFFSRLPFRVINYRRCETPKTVLMKRSRSKFRQPLRFLTLITLLSLATITFDTTNESASSDLFEDPSLFCIDNTVSIFMISKGKPLRFSTFLTLMLAGDVNPNPGPVAKKTCNFCFRTIAKNHRYVTCCNCGLFYQIKCGGVSPNLYNRMQVDDSISFTCQPCIYNNVLPFADVDLSEEEDNFILPDNIEPLNLFKSSCLNMAHLNVNGLRSKLDFIKILLFQEKFDILCLNETKIDSTVSDNDLSIPGYTPHRQDRTAHGGGTLIYVSDVLHAKKVSRISRKEHEAIWIEVKPKKAKPVYICSLYRPPSNKAIEHVKRYTEYLSNCFESLPKDSEVFILGDFNVDIPKKNNLSSLVNELCKSKSLTQYVSSPTRVTEYSSSTIDLALSNSKHAGNCKVIDLGISDHSLVYIRREKIKIERKPRTITTRSFKNFNQEAFLEDLGNLDWSNVVESNDIDSATDAFNSNLISALDRHAPLVQKRIRHDSPPWLNDGLLDAIKERDYLKKVAAKSGKQSIEWKRYQKKRNAVIKLNNRLKREHFQKELSDNASQSRKLWKTINKLIPGKKQCASGPKSIIDNGVEVSDKKEMARVFNDFFASIGAKLAETFNFNDTNHINPPINNNHFVFSNVRLSTVQKIISNLDNNKATGLDEINVRALKAGSPILSYYLTFLFNLSLTTGKVPKCWKKKRVTPVFKKGETDDVNNYRPISILSVSMKIFEKVVHSQVYDFLKDSKILSENQSGFRNSHSTDTAVICVSDYILEQLGKKKYVGAVLVDLKKAFDTVDHRILLKKLFCHGFRDCSFDWFESYLSDRVQCTMLENTQSSFTTESPYGVPQGSVLGPLLFLIYINDIGSSIQSDTFYHLYADDTIIIKSADSPEDLTASLENQLVDLGHWFHQNKLSVNTTKTEAIFFGRPIKVQECKEQSVIRFQGDVIEQKSKVKYLGVTFDENMSWDEQAKLVRQKSYLSLNKIKRVSPFLNNETKKLLINALVMPHITYCSNSWSTMSKTHHNNFESLMRNINKVVPSFDKTFQQVSSQSKAMMVFKGINKIAPEYLSKRLELVKNRHERTRFAVDHNLTVHRSVNKFTDRTFINSSTSVWNNLPVEIKSLKSIVSFKNSLKKYLYD